MLVEQARLMRSTLCAAHDQAELIYGNTATEAYIDVNENWEEENDFWSGVMVDIETVLVNVDNHIKEYEE